ncbi:MAG TPA: PadR family transcriptional regulator [Candidatus Limnocylindria bacterium]
MSSAHARHAASRRLMHEIFGPLREGYAAVRRGKVRPMILAVLHERPMHGYQVMQELEARTGGRWRPSPGSIYPTLQQLEDEGMVRTEELDGRKVYRLSDEGRAAAEASPLTRHPWFDKRSAPESLDLRRLAVQLIGATIQVQRVGSEEAQKQAREILVDSRRRLYRLLADDDAGDLADFADAMKAGGAEDAEAQA